MGAVVPFSDPGPARRIARLNDSMLALQQALAGRYALERQLGKGGMGIVYLAWETALNRPVALKILPPALATQRRRERFLKEAEIAARLTHDHIVPIYAVDEAGPFVYYTMKYIPGETLTQRIIAEGPLDVGQVTRILHDVARAVEYAHERGVIHRDLKPSNILIEHTEDDSRPRAYVADFGLARVMADGRPPGGGGGGTFGTCAYVSPEQATGLAADRRSDVYSLGVVAYVMATGRPLFAGTPTEVLKQHIAAPAPPLPVVGRHLDTTLARAVNRCLAKHPRDRFQSAGELARALARAPELRADLPLPLREYLARLKLESRSAPGGVLLGLGALGVLARALEAGQWGTATGALGFLVLLCASPVAGALPATRRLLGQGYTRQDIVHALHMDLDRQREQLAARRGRVADRSATVARRLVVFALGLFGVATLAAASGADLPDDLVFFGMVIGAFTAIAGGGVLVWRERRRNELTGRRWLRFWESRLGAWAVKLAGLGLGRVPTEAELPGPAPAPLRLAAEPPGAPAGRLDDFRDVVQRTESCARRARACLAAAAATRRREGTRPTPEQLEREHTLERQLAVLETLLDQVRGSPGSLTADLEAARAVCEAAQALIAGREWRPTEPPAP